MTATKTGKTQALTKVTVTGPAQGRRRAGFAIGPEASAIEVNEEQLLALHADPWLAVIDGWPKPPETQTPET